MNAAGYSRLFVRLLPPGVLWALEEATGIRKVFDGMAEEFARFDLRTVAFLDETDPRTATETLPEWERSLGLPDDVILEIPGTVEARRQAVVQKFLRQGGQSIPYYVRVAASVGYVVTVYNTYAVNVLRIGARIGDRLYGLAWVHTWRVDVQPPVGPALSHEELERIIRRAAPAHTDVLFNYL